MKKGLPFLKGMIEKDDSSYYYFSLQYGELSRIDKVRRNLTAEVLHPQLSLHSSRENGNKFKKSIEEDVHDTREGMKTFPSSKWSRYPCPSYGTSKNDVDKYRRRN